MSIQQIGRWVFMAMGVFTLLHTFLVTIKSETAKFLTALVFGVLMLGVGAFGLPFLREYQSYFDLLKDIVNHPTSENYTKLFHMVGEGDLPGELAEVGLAFTLERPIDGMKETLTNAIGQAKSSEGKQQLESAQAVLQLKENVARQLVGPSRPQADLSQREIDSYDPATRAFIANRLLNAPGNRLDNTDLDKSYLEKLKRPEAMRFKR